MSKDEPTVSLIAGAADEAAWQLQVADRCSEATLQAHIFPFYGSEWSVSATDEDEYVLDITFTIFTDIECYLLLATATINSGMAAGY